MLSIISPSKTMDLNCRSIPLQTQPHFMSEARELCLRLKKLSPADLEELMKISPKLAALTHERFQAFSGTAVNDGSRQALLVYKGDAFQSLDIDHYQDQDFEFEFAQNHIRILSGLYGLLRPLDLIEPHRLEIATRLSGSWGKTLYEFWAERITQRLDTELEASKGAPVLINLASNEYFKAVQHKRLKAKIITIQFKEKKGNAFKVIAIHAKRARGLLADFIIREKTDEPESLKEFSGNGYTFNPTLSTSDTWVFSRE
nr:peroxide stress protein YaaA [uncultured Desulfobacter sp.]